VFPLLFIFIIRIFAKIFNSFVMEQLTATSRIELEIKIRETAISIARFGFAGIDFFCRQFPDIAKEYTRAMEQEDKSAIFEPIDVRIAH
jgi:hypothetical protein